MIVAEFNYYYYKRVLTDSFNERFLVANIYKKQYTVLSFQKLLFERDITLIC